MNNESFDSHSEKVLGAVFEVANVLGAGFLEKVYERALIKELGSGESGPRRRLPCRLPIRGSTWGSTSRTSWLRMCLSSN